MFKNQNLTGRATKSTILRIDWLSWSFDKWKYQCSVLCHSESLCFGLLDDQYMQFEEFILGFRNLRLVFFIIFGHLIHQTFEKLMIIEIILSYTPSFMHQRHFVSTPCEGKVCIWSTRCHCRSCLAKRALIQFRTPQGRLIVERLQSSGHENTRLLIGAAAAAAAKRNRPRHRLTPGTYKPRN